MKIYIQDFTLINSLGNSKEEVAQKLFNENIDDDHDEFSLLSGEVVPCFRIKGDLPEIPREFPNHDSFNNRILLKALSNLESPLKNVIKKYGPSKVGVVIGTSTSGIKESIAAAVCDKDFSLENYNYGVQEMGSPGRFVKDYLKLKSVAYSVSTACSSSSRAVVEGYRLIESGLCEAVIVGGCDSLNMLTVNGFDSLNLISRKRCNPFSSNRNGINIGEAAALFILTKEKSNLCILGVGESSDAYHISAPHPEGRGAIKAMKQALESSQLEKNEIDYINLHGTGSLKNDVMESIAINEIFNHNPLVSSTKPLVGHTLGAAGGTELGFCALTLSNHNARGNTPFHFWDRELDQEIKPLNFSTPSKQYKKPKICMSNSFAFGGNNVSLIIGQVQ